MGRSWEVKQKTILLLTLLDTTIISEMQSDFD